MNEHLEEYKDIIVPIILKHVPQAKIILYGSRARGDSKEGSDIDIALDIGTPIDKSLLSEIEWDLEDSDLPILFDIVDLAKISADMKKSILKDGIIWKI